MGYEIYYTSAPEGIKRGTSGFCTVAASENIPKALWDRLETLSAYRHNAAGANPVSFGHCLLTVTGRTYHVLSRVCDAGVDHTQRTNSFAHHLVLEQREMEMAAAGPVWMLRQAGVLAGAWDGRVGNLAMRMLPGGPEESASRVCRRWEEATGDAGWGGHLAELFAKTPTKPVCIVFPATGAFSDGEGILELLGEALALLPPAARWNVTFNTYFTSMPTSATCLWRCCLAGSPAAELGKRYAASGLILDLTDPARIGAAPANGPLVQAARTGQMPESLRPQAPTTKPSTPKVETGSVPLPPKAPPPPREWMTPEAEEDVYAEAGELGFADDIAPTGGQVTGSAATGGWRDNVSGGARLRNAERALEAAEREAEHAAIRRRRQVMGLFVGALLAIGLGMATVLMMKHRWASEPPALPTSVEQPTPMVAPSPGPEAVTPAHAAPEPAPVPVTPDHVTPTVVETPAGSPPPPAPAAHFPEVLTPLAALERPNVGTGIGDRTQQLALKREDLDAAQVTGLRLTFPIIDQSGSAAGISQFANEDSGTLTAAAGKEKRSVALLWKKTGDGGNGTEVLTIAFIRAQPALEVRWHSSMLLKNAPLMGYYYWMLQNSEIELERGPEAGMGVPQRVQLKPFDAGSQDFEQPQMTVRWPVELPKGVTVSAPEKNHLAGEWEASWFTDWEEKDAALRSAQNASQVLKFKRGSPSGGDDLEFLMTFRPGLGTIESTFARQRAAGVADLEKKRAALDGFEKKIAEAGPTARQMNQPIDPALLANRDLAAKQVTAGEETVKAYDALTQFDVDIELKGGTGRMRIESLHFERPGGPAGK